MTEDTNEHLGSSDGSSKRMQAALERIRELASWHYDPAVDESDTSPDDQVAHVNGLIVRACVEALESDEQ